MTKRQLVKWLEAKQSDAKAEVEIQYATAEKAYFAQRDEAHLAKKLGDVAWYLAVTAHAIGYDLETVLQMNVDKLRNRYPNGFEKERSLHRQEGGLFDHSYMVARYLKKLTEDCRLDWQNQRSPLLVGMFHDLCKMDNYQHPVVAETLGGEEIRDDSKWEYAMDTLLKGHGDKSVMVLAQYFKLTEEEIMCIRYHMGAFCDKSEWNDYTRAVHKYTNVLWTHQADMLASHVEGV